jgi:hypothetical protein
MLCAYTVVPLFYFGRLSPHFSSDVRVPRADTSQIAKYVVSDTSVMGGLDVMKSERLVLCTLHFRTKFGQQEA